MARSHARRRRFALLLALPTLVVVGCATASAECEPAGVLALRTAGPTLTVHGPNGSQDPALGFHPGCSPVV